MNARETTVAPKEVRPPAKSVTDLGEQQRAVIETVWELGEATVHDVRDRLNPDLAYTTVLATMQQLEKAGWLRHRVEGRAHVYRARRSRQEEGTRSLRQFTQRVFGGDPLRLFQHLIEDERLTDADLLRLKAMIDQTRRDRRNE